MDRRISTMLPFGRKKKQEKEIEEMIQRQKEREQEERVQALERRLNEEQRLREKQESERARLEEERIRDEDKRRQDEAARDLERQNMLRQAEWNRQEAIRIQNEALEAERRKKHLLEQEVLERQRRKEEDKKKRLRMTNPETLRELRELIRTRYELDVKIWSLRKVRKPDRPMIEEDMERADAVMAEIMEIIRAWEGSEAWWSKNEWEQVEQIIDKLNADGKRSWMGNAPWEED